MCYLRLSNYHRAKCVKKIRDFLKKKKIKFDSFVGRGVSGITMASMLAYSMNKNLVIVRKDRTNNHSGQLVEGIITNEHQFIIIDDFVETGETIEQIDRAIHNYGTVKGVVLYNSMSTKKNNQRVIKQNILYQTFIPVGKS